MNIAEELIEHLEGLGNGTIKPLDPRSGICCVVAAFIDRWRLLYRLFEDWKEKSDHPHFPVPHPTKDPFDAYYSSSDLWGDNEYGDARRRLCLFLANKYRKELTK